MHRSTLIPRRIKPALLLLLLVAAGQLGAEPQEEAEKRPSLPTKESADSEVPTEGQKPETSPEEQSPETAEPADPSTDNPAPKEKPANSGSRIVDLCPDISESEQNLVDLLSSNSDLTSIQLVGLSEDLGNLDGRKFRAALDKLITCQEQTTSQLPTKYAEEIKRAIESASGIDNLLKTESAYNFLALSLASLLNDSTRIPNPPTNWPPRARCKRCAEILEHLLHFQDSISKLPRASNQDQRLAAILESKNRLYRPLAEACSLAQRLERIHFSDEFSDIRYYLKTASVEAAIHMQSLIRNQDILLKCKQK